MPSSNGMNVLFICADQWRGDSLSILNHSVVRTPHLDALANDGVLFRNHFTQCTPCGPSRTSLLTGLYLMNHRSGRNGTPLDGRHTNIALEMRKGGYDPVLFGYTDTSVNPMGRHPNDPALRYYDEGVMPGFTTLLHMPEHMAPWVGALKARGYDLPNGRADVFKPRTVFDKPANRGFRYIPAIYDAADSDTAFVTDRFLEWLSTQRKNWFAHVVYMRPHPPIIAPEPYNALYDPALMPLPLGAADIEQEARAHPFVSFVIKKMDRVGDYDEENPNNFLHMDELELRQTRATFNGLMTEVDHHIGRIVEYLKSTGEYDRTLIIFTSDHGEMLGDHHIWGKEVFFDQAMHVPLIIRDPSSAARAKMVDAFTQAIDVMPTILDRFGLSIPVTCDGLSLAGFLDSSADVKWRQEAFWEHDFRDIVDREPETFLGLPSDACNYAVLRDVNFKYVHFAGLRPLLYDMQNDPGETTDLASDLEYSDVVLGYAQRMLNWRLTSVDRGMTHSLLTPMGLYNE